MLRHPEDGVCLGTGIQNPLPRKRNRRKEIPAVEIQTVHKILIMDTAMTIQAVIDLANENDSLRRENDSIKRSYVNADRFYNVPMTVSMVAELHSVSPDLVRKYVKKRLIETHPKSTDAKILIRASDALMLDFKELRKIYKIL